MRNLIAKSKNQGEVWALGFWAVLPFLGQLTAPFFVLSAPLFRNRQGALRRPLVALTGLCSVYLLYISLVSLPYEGASEPIGDTFSLILTVAIATWVLRDTHRLTFASVYKISAVVLHGIFLLTAIANIGFGVDRPALLMKNPLNLSPLLLMPAMICTFTSFAPSRLWRWVGILGFALGLITLALILQARGTTLVLFGLCLVRIAWFFLKSASPAHVLGVASLIVLSSVAVVLLTDVDALLKARFSSSVETAQSNAETGAAMEQSENAAAQDQLQTQTTMNTTSDHSINQRLAMLQGGWQAFKQRPLFGHGAQNRFDAARPFLPTDFGPRYSHLHNEFVTHAVAGGIPAVVLLSIILAFPVLLALSQKNRGGDALQIAVLFSAAFAGTGMVNNVLFVDISAFALGVSFVFAALVIEIESVSTGPSSGNNF